MGQQRDGRVVHSTAPALMEGFHRVEWGVYVDGNLMRVANPRPVVSGFPLALTAGAPPHQASGRRRPKALATSNKATYAPLPSDSHER
jgi:hypothetical protein